MSEPNEDNVNNGNVQEEDDIDPVKLAEVNAELRANFAKLEEEFRNVFDVKMVDFTSSVESERSAEHAQHKTDVLRTNKVFRDVARPLAGRWRVVLEHLLQKLPADQVTFLCIVPKRRLCSCGRRRMVVISLLKSISSIMPACKYDPLTGPFLKIWHPIGCHT